MINATKKTDLDEA